MCENNWGRQRLTWKKRTLKGNEQKGKILNAYGLTYTTIMSKFCFFRYNPLFWFPTWRFQLSQVEWSLEDYTVLQTELDDLVWKRLEKEWKKTGHKVGIICNRTLNKLIMKQTLERKIIESSQKIWFLFIRSIKINMSLLIKA